MSRNREPVGHTCPDIDKIISILENIRSANDELRTWGNKEAQRVDELEGQVSDLDEENDTLQARINELESEIDNLKNKIDELESTQNA